MNKKNIKADKFFNQKKQILDYNNIYGDINFDLEYPSNVKRLKIILSILSEISPKNILDAGCGNALPMISILKKGFKCKGFDHAPNMIAEAKKNLVKNAYKSNLVTKGNFENYKTSELFDCILGMGTFYYSKNTLKTIKNMTSILSPKGDIVFSLRNKLFDLVTLNQYTRSFLEELYSSNKKSKLNKSLSNALDIFSNKRIKQSAIDSNKVFSSVHNPLTVEQELLVPNNLKLEKIYFYHYHAYPPILEKQSPKEFRKKSWRMEDPLNWKGYFLASAFVVHAKKITF